MVKDIRTRNPESNTRHLVERGASAIFEDADSSFNRAVDLPEAKHTNVEGKLHGAVCVSSTSQMGKINATSN
jgi:hypothetical protein